MQSKKFEVLEHIGDLKIKSFGKTKEELFLNAMRGMFVGGNYKFEIGDIKRNIKISSYDLASLLVDFLSEILYFCETKKEVYQDIIFKKFSNKEIEAVLIGGRLKKIGTQIKGVAYHNLEIKKEKGEYTATIIFDI